MSSFDYRFVQGISDFGRGLAASIVGQPFIQYRLGDTSSGNVVADPQIVNNDLRAKVTHGAQALYIENEVLQASVFNFLVPASAVQNGDILVQNDQAFGSNTLFAVASRRPLKSVMCIRVESLVTVYRLSDNRGSGYSGPTRATNLPFVLNNGLYSIGATTDTPSQIPFGLEYAGKIRGSVADKLPTNSIPTWWMGYLPFLPGLELVQENDLIQFPTISASQMPITYRIVAAFSSAVGTVGHFLLLEKM